MRRAQGASIAIGLLLLAAAGTAHAVESARSAPLQISAQTDTKAVQPGAVTATSNTRWDASKGRWGFMVDVGRLGTAVKNILAGAYYRLTPSLKVGSSVGYGSDEELDAAKNRETPKTPRVKLEANFNF